MELEVWLNGEHAGRLKYLPATHLFSFEYTPKWTWSDHRYELCPGLPLEADPEESPQVHSAAVRQFFENLLPEGQALDDAARTHKLSKGNLMGLLAALGGETAGALQLRMPGVEPVAVPDERRALTHEELSERIRARPYHPFSVWDGRVRLSIAGYQDKVAVYEDAGQWFLVEGSRLASTHILKPEPITAALAGLAANEYFCMRLAHWAKLPVAPARLVQVPEPVLAVTRFDRERRADGVARRHIIDGCQALGLSSSLKYERPYGDLRDVANLREGASLPMLFRLLYQSPSPAAQRLALLRWVIFQVLIGNTDAHAKNVSFYVQPGGLVLAPAYDLVCGLAFDAEKLLDTYAMAIGDAFHPAELSPFEWANFAHACGLSFKQVSKELKTMSERVLQALPKTCAELTEARVALEIVERIKVIINRECKRQAEMAPQVAKVSAELF